jgi:hypothetical protein
MATTGAAVVTFSGADMAFAKSENANGGNRGGNGNRSSERGGNGKSHASQGKGPNGQGAERSTAGRGNGNIGKAIGSVFGGTNRGGGGDRLFGFIPRHEPNGNRGSSGGPATVQRAAPQASVRPVARSAEKEDERLYGNSWKTRLDDGVLETHPRELGPWNSAKRNPQAIANMVEKYERTGEMTGAGGMIGYLVSSYWALDGVDGERTAYFSTLQTAVHDEGLPIDAARRLFESPPLSQEEFDALLYSEEYAGKFEVIDGVVDCAGETDCNEDDRAFLQTELDALTFLAENEGADGDYYAALEAAAEADELVQPNFSPEDEAIRETMLADVKDLLDIDQDDYEFDDPEADESGSDEEI